MRSCDTATHTGVLRREFLGATEETRHLLCCLAVFGLPKHLKKPEPHDSDLRITGQAAPAHDWTPLGVKASCQAPIGSLLGQQDISGFAGSLDITRLMQEDA